MIQQKTARIALAIVGLAAGVSFATQASAAGCNGVVNQLEWGCAAWDNNNGPKFPHYKGAAKPAAAAPKAVIPAPAAAAARPAVAPNGGSGIVAQGGGNIVAQGGGNAVNKNGSGIVAQGGGNAVHK